MAYEIIPYITQPTGVLNTAHVATIAWTSRHILTCFFRPRSSKYLVRIGAKGPPFTPPEVRPLGGPFTPCEKV